MTVRENAIMQADSILCAMSDRQKRTVALRHTYGVAALCAMLAAKRGLDVQLCELMGLMHDLYTFKTGHKNNHSYNGADMARIMLKRAGKEETQYAIIANALYNHSAKAYVHDAYSELLKDADLLHYYLSGKATATASNSKLKRLQSVLDELNIPHDTLALTPITELPSEPFSCAKLAQVAQELLSHGEIRASRDNSRYMAIIAALPDDSAFDELCNSWCAQFVFYCCELAGLSIPIRRSATHDRFACVGAWVSFGKDEGFYTDISQIVPQRGDIVICNRTHILPEAPEGKGTFDHIGIVLDFDGELLTVAEGNYGGTNRSAITKRPIDAHIAGILRIPDGYTYDFLSHNFMTGERVEPMRL